MLERQKGNLIFYRKRIPNSVLSVTTLAYSDIFSKFYLPLIQFMDEFQHIFVPECIHPKPHVLYWVPLEFSQSIVILYCISGRKLSLSAFLTSFAATFKSQKW